MERDVPVKQNIFKGKKLIVISIVVIIILISSSFFYGMIMRPYWDNGKWQSTTSVSSNYNVSLSPIAITFQDEIHMFYSYISKSTITMPESDVSMPDEYVLWDIIYRTFDGTNWSEEVELTSPSNEISEGISGHFIYKNKLYVRIEQNWIENNTSYEWNSTTIIKSFDGINWSNNTIFNQVNGSTILVDNDTIWTFWKIKMHTRFNEFAYRKFDGVSWSEQQNFTFPTSSAHAEKFKIINDEIWVAWADWSVQHTQDIYLGKFDGFNWSNVTMLTLPDDFGVNFRPDIIQYNNTIYVSWESAVSSEVAFGGDNTSDFHIVVRSYHNGSIGEVTKVSTDDRKGNYYSQMCVYNEKLYFLWYHADHEVSHDQHCLIRSFDGKNFSTIYGIYEPSRYGGDYPQLIVYNEKLWIYVSEETDEQTTISFRSYS